MAGMSAGGSSNNGGNGGSGVAGTPNEVTNEAIIDNFSSCDGFISRVAGRDGSWYTFGDNDVNVTPNTSGSSPPPAASTPPSGFSSSACAAWVTGGCTETADDCTYGGNGFTFRSDSSGYDVRQYNGIQFDYEGGEVWVVVTMSQGHAFGISLPASGGARRTRSFRFDELVVSGETPQGTPMNLSSVRQVEFTTLTPSGFGQAIWDIRFF